MKQTRVLKQESANKHSLGVWIASGWIFFFAVLFLTWRLIPQDMTLAINTPSAVWVFAFAHLFFASLILFVGFLAVGATRWQIETKDASANPATVEKNSSDTDINNRIHTQFLSNSTEQFVMFSAALLAATPFLTQSYLRIIPLMTVLWIFGRLFFWGGYWYTASRGLPTYPRAVGLGMGLLCTLVLAAIAAIGISLYFPSFTTLFEATNLGAASLNPSISGIIKQPDTIASGSNLLPIGLISLIVLIISTLAIFPRPAPPVIPMALISIIGWGWLLASGAIPIRF